MFRIVLLILLSAILTFVAVSHAEEDPQFTQKLQEMLRRTDKSIEILREQIVDNQSAPFISDLYLQLGEMLSQRANALYYIQMERHKISSQTATATKEFNPVVETQKEAVAIFRKIIDEFPNYEKRKKVLFLLAVTYKSIDEQVGFEDTTDKLIKEFGKTKEGMQGRLLLGQHYFDKNEHEKAWAYFVPVEKSSFPYERNLARYRMGLINLTREKHRESLELFRSVVVDEELKEEDNPFAVSLETKSVKSSLKREALIDSIRAYTYVFKVNPDPVGYYSAICPTEVLFQEVIEKLAYRYISIKKYEHAVGLLRTLSERLADPQKIINIYHEVLLAIPLEDRIDIPVDEIRFVLEKYNVWSNYYDLPSKVKAEAAVFFEKQIRDLGTKSHDRAKIKGTKTVAKDLVKARDFYLLYLGFYPNGKNSVKMATNLGDVYFRMGNYLKSGEYYLRVFSGEFGPPANKDKKPMIENAILILQKNQKNSYFDQLRVRGLLHRAIQDYMKFDKSQTQNPNLVFTFIKNQYDQGFYEASLTGFLDYIKKFPDNKNAINAGEIIMDYFNTKNDVTGLNEWANKILAINKLNPTMKKRIAALRSQAQLKKLQETVKATTGGDEFAQGKGYLQAALTVADAGLKSVALQQALSRSRSEQDFETFFKAAKLIADKESQPEQKFKVLKSIPQELIGMGRFYSAIDQFIEIAKRKDVNATNKAEVFNSAVNIALLLRDFDLVEQLMARHRYTLNAANLKRMEQQIADALESPAEVSGTLLKKALTKGDETSLMAAFKGQFKFPNQRSKILATVQRYCKSQPASALCGWQRLSALDSERATFVSEINKLGTNLELIEPTAQKFVQVMSSHQAYLNYRDPVLQIALTLRNKQLHEAFAGYLNRVAKANPEVKSILEKKVQEGARNAKLALKRCQTIMDGAGLYSPINRYCSAGRVPTVAQALTWKKIVRFKVPGRDPQDPAILERQKILFVNPSKGEEYMALIREYQKRGYMGLVAASSVYGSSAFPDYKDEMNAVLGCSLIPMGLYSEAAYYLTAASSEPESQQCRRRLEGLLE